MKRRKAQRTNQNIMRGIVAMALVVLLVAWLFLSLISCKGSGPTFRVDGAITGAEDSTLIVEAMTLTGVEALDSVKLKADGSFAFDLPLAPLDSTSSPEFYRLRIAQQVINFAHDSTEAITITAPFAKMATDYDVQGNEASRTMKTISLLNIQLQQQFHRLLADGSLSELEKSERLQVLVDEYKQTLKRDYILSDPASAAAYFALFQTIGSQMLFDPERDKNDVQYFAAVATQWDLLYPASQRTQNLRNIAIRGLRNTRPPQPISIEIDSDKVTEVGVIDFGFPDIRGNERRLTQLRVNVVLLDFTAYALPNSQERNIRLRELYNKYHSRGLEIMQVSLDADEHYWKTMCERLPWVCVYCAEGITNDIVRLYGVESLPAYFLVGRGAELKARGEQIKDIEKAIEAEL